MITDIEDYFAQGCGRCDRFGTPDCSTRRWHAGLLDLRRICSSEGLDETVKWGHPCYVRGARNIAIIGAFRDDFRLSFFNPSLLKDPEGVLERRGPNTRVPGMMRFTDVRDVGRREQVIRAYLREAIGYADKGVQPARADRPLELPAELEEALAADPDLADAFAALTPGRQRSYAIHVGGAKKAETRRARIEKFRPKIFAGKGATER